MGDCAAILRLLLRPKELAIGPAIEEYESAFAATIGVASAVSFASGRVALYSILKAYGIGDGDEVLLQAPTHVVVPNAIRYTGARPVFVDCREEDYNIDFDSAERRLTSKTRAILLQHTFGIPVDMDRARTFAQTHGLVVIEDCVHALGSEYDGRPVGSLGDAAFFSTEETKTISSTMGGVAVTNDPQLAERIRGEQAAAAIPSRTLVARYLIKQVVYHLFTHPNLHLLTRPIYMWLRQRMGDGLAPGATSDEESNGQRPRGYTMRFSSGQASVALRQLERLGANVAHRRLVAERYRARLPELGYLVTEVSPGAVPSHVRFPVRVADRDAAMRIAADRVILGRWFTSVLEEASTPQAGGYRAGECPRAERLAQELVNLPTHQRVTAGDVDRVLELMAQIQPAPSGD
jgi:dTDP-4-amino-4,6-dideoxygalactose transaminase